MQSILNIRLPDSPTHAKPAQNDRLSVRYAYRIR